MSDDRVGVVGLGWLGRGIASCLLAHNLEVVGWAPSGEEQASAEQQIDRDVEEMIEHGGFDASIRNWRDRFTPTTDYNALRDCTFIIESVAEDLAIKRSVFDRIEAVVGEDVPIATNTSALPIGSIQSGRRNPARILGMHWAGPAHATLFLELIRGEQTGDAAMAAADALGRRVGKDPCVLNRDIPAFIVNRLNYAMYREALYLVEAGVADFQTIDRAFRYGTGLWSTLAGPFRWIDISGGPALYAKAMRGVLPTLSDAVEVPPTIQNLADAGARGTADGQGFYQYTPQEAERWQAMWREHAWTIFKLHRKYLQAGRAPTADAPA